MVMCPHDDGAVVGQPEVLDRIGGVAGEGEMSALRRPDMSLLGLRRNVTRLMK